MGFEVLELCNTADNKGTGKNEFTSLFGNDKKKNYPCYQNISLKVLWSNTYTEITKVGAFPRLEHSEWNPVF